MEIRNAYSAVAEEDLHLYDFVVIKDGSCRSATHGDTKAGCKLFQVIDEKVSRGETATLAGDDTVFDIRL